uniref:Ig-like domain-containing protein n=1 Tax=Panagrellus redivivus TaxID=6233 RepID=A0A7E4V4G0_PANRE
MFQTDIYADVKPFFKPSRAYVGCMHFRHARLRNGKQLGSIHHRYHEDIAGPSTSTILHLHDSESCAVHDKDIEFRREDTAGSTMSSEVETSTTCKPRRYGYCQSSQTQSPRMTMKRSLLHRSRESRCFHEPYRLFAWRSSSPHSKPPSRSSLQSLSSQLWVSLLLFITFFASMASASLLPFGSGPTPGATASGINGTHLELVTFERFSNSYLYAPSTTIPSLLSASDHRDGFRYVPETAPSEHFVISELFAPGNPLPTFICNATIAPQFGMGESLPVSWIDANTGQTLSDNDTLIFETAPINETKVRCKAEIFGFNDTVDGAVISRSIVLSFERYLPLVVKPELTVIHPNQPVRLICYWNPALKASITWHDANGPIDGLQYANLEGYSILHLRSVSESTNITCSMSGIHSKPAVIKVSEKAKMTTDAVAAVPDLITTPINGMAVFECPASENVTIKWTHMSSKTSKNNTTKNYINKQLESSTTLLVFKDVTPEFAGNLKCVITDDQGNVNSLDFEFNVVGNPSYFDVPSKVLNEVTRKQGTPLSSRCRTYPHLGEDPEDAKWFFNGEPFVRSPYVKVVTSTQNGVGYSDMLIAIAEGENEGLYSCVVDGPTQVERIQQFIARVDVTTNETIDDAKIDVDHENRCLIMSFTMPKSSDLNFAEFTTYFIVIYDPHDPESSLNSLPKSAQCNYKRKCKIKLCHDSTEMLEPAKEYAFRVSTVIGGAGAVITPMSPVILATTWDGEAESGVPVNWMITEDNEIRITWDTPSVDVLHGAVDHYMVQLADYSELTSNLLGARDRDYFTVDAGINEFIISNISMPFAYKVRVIAITRNLKHNYQSFHNIENFPFFLLSSDNEVALQSLPLPEFTIEQPGKQPAILIRWKYESPPPGRFIIFRYNNILSTRVDPVDVFIPVNTRSVNVVNRIEGGYVYQVCATYKSIDGEHHGPWRCYTTSVKDEHDRLAFTTVMEAVKSKQLPLPVTCKDGQRCECKPSDKVEGGIRVEWDPPKAERETSYLVHYTFNETDPSGKEVESPEPGETFVELPPLVPGATYRIMISSSNEYGDSVDGSFFSCKTPSDGALPPPKNFGYTILNETHVELHWTPLALGENAHLVNGYTIFWHADGYPVAGTFVNGSKTSTYVIGGLRFQSLYSAYIVSHSPSSGESSLKANELFIRLPPGSESTTPFVIPWYNHPTLKFVLVVIAIVLAIILMLLLCFGFCWIYVYPRYSEYKKRKEESNLLTQKANSNASSALTIHSESNMPIIQPEVCVESCPLLNFPGLSPDEPFTDFFDTKGPAGGPRPLGNRRYMQMMADPEYQARIAELNQDPTGLGLPAGTRDTVYMRLRGQSEHNRRFEKVINAERQELDKRKRFFKRRSRANAKNSTGTETSFITVPDNLSRVISRATPPASIHGGASDAESESLISAAKRRLTSHSLTELSKPITGLSPRSNSIARVMQFFKPRPTVVNEPPVSIAMVEMGASPPQSPASSVNGVPAGAPASSLPNLADSGIVFDEHNSSATSSASTGPSMPPIRQASASGSLTLTTDDQSSDLLHLRDCRQGNGVIGGPGNRNPVAATVMP